MQFVTLLYEQSHDNSGCKLWTYRETWDEVIKFSPIGFLTSHVDVIVIAIKVPGCLSTPAANKNPFTAQNFHEHELGKSPLPSGFPS